MADRSDSLPADEAIAEFLVTVNGGQYLILAEAIRQLGGELRIRPKPGLEVDGDVVLRLAESRQ